MAITCGALLPSCVSDRRSGPSGTLVKANSSFHEATRGRSGLNRNSSESWWKSFKDRALNRLIDEALSHNLTLQAARSRILQANAELRQAGGRLLPTVDADGSYATRWSDDTNRTEESSRIGALFDWELDVWGKLRAARNARASELDAAVSDLLGARLLLSASVAETYFQILEQKQQLRLLEEQIETGQTLLDLIELRFGQAQSSVVDVLQQREQLAATRTLQPTVEARLQQLEYALDVLLGKAPGNGTRVRYRALTFPPPHPDAGIPSNLLLNRPDLVAASHRIQAIDFEVAEAIADQLPQFRLTGTIAGIGTPQIDTILANAIASFAAPILDGGVRKQEVLKRQAEMQEAVANYSHRYLEAVRDVESALAFEKKQYERVQRVEKQLDIAQKLLRESENRYSQGLTDYLPVLTAIVIEQNLQRDLVTDRRELVSLRISLHRALGGPMDLRKLSNDP